MHIEIGGRDEITSDEGINSLKLRWIDENTYSLYNTRKNAIKLVKKMSV